MSFLGGEMRCLHWFRADLRVSDNRALAAAMVRADELLAVFYITPETWRFHDMAPIQVNFLLANLRALSSTLNKCGIQLLVRQVPTFTECVKDLENLCDQLEIQHLFYNRQYEYDEYLRDQDVLKFKRVTVHEYDDQVVLAPGMVLSQKEQAFQVFTPFKKRWLQVAEEHGAWQPISTPMQQFRSRIEPDDIPDILSGFNSELEFQQWPPGEQAALKKLTIFCEKKLGRYQDQRDFPAEDATSQLSPYLSIGVLSPRQCISVAMKASNITSLNQLSKNTGVATWISELIWREFYKHIVYFYPRVCKYKAFRSQYDQVPWRYDEQLFKAWCEGNTGFPFVDAAMRQLNQTGWMHNRLRMVVAMFLSKTLFLDWRWGEKYFMQHLIDGDFAANNGGWQWSASTGTDAAPYFRIFNPITQSERFDPQGEFIRQYCPELSSLDNKSIHNPYHRGVNPDEINYPEQIVDYHRMRPHVINAFKAMK